VTLSDLASIGSFVSGVAVAVTLVFLVMQMRQANRYQRASMQLGRAARYENTALRVSNPEVVRVTVKALKCEEPLTDVETRLWMNTVYADFRSWEDTFLQHRAGLLERASKDSDEAVTATFLTNPAYRVMWQFVSLAFNEDFRAYADAIMARTQPFPGGDVAPAYNSALREQVAQIKNRTVDPKDYLSAFSQMRDAMKSGKDQ
jgi:hypothetical protein